MAVVVRHDPFEMVFQVHNIIMITIHTRYIIYRVYHSSAVYISLASLAVSNNNENIALMWATVKLGDTLSVFVKPRRSCRTNSTTIFMFGMLQPYTLF